MFWYWAYRLYSKHIDCILAVVLCRLNLLLSGTICTIRSEGWHCWTMCISTLTLATQNFSMLHNFRGSGFDKVSVRCLILFIYTHQNDDLWLINWSVLITGTCIASNWLQKCYYIQLIIYTLQSYIFYMSEFRAI